MQSRSFKQFLAKSTGIPESALELCQADISMVNFFLDVASFGDDDTYLSEEELMISAKQHQGEKWFSPTNGEGMILSHFAK